MLVNVKKITLPEEIIEYSANKPREIPAKYWSRRYDIFSKFDEGILMDSGSWHSATHESIAKIIAFQCKKFNSIIDGFAGVGGAAIQFAKYAKTIAIDIDENKINMLRHNS